MPRFQALLGAREKDFRCFLAPFSFPHLSERGHQTYQNGTRGTRRLFCFFACLLVLCILSDAQLRGAKMAVLDEEALQTQRATDPEAETRTIYSLIGGAPGLANTPDYIRSHSQESRQSPRKLSHPIGTAIV